MVTFPSGKAEACVCNLSNIFCSKKKCTPCVPCSGWEATEMHWRGCCEKGLAPADARKMKKGKAKNDQMIINGTLSGESVRILIDTGASLTFISGTFLKKN